MWDFHRENSRNRAVTEVGDIEVGWQMAQTLQHSRHIQVESDRFHMSGSKEYKCNVAK